MEVLIIISPNAKMSELKKIPKLVDDLVKRNIKIIFMNIGFNQSLENYLVKIKYSNFNKLNFSMKYSIEEKFILLKEYYFENIIVLGLIKNDKITKFLDYYIGTNTNLFLITPKYGVYSDSFSLINDGAYLLGSVNDLLKP